MRAFSFFIVSAIAAAFVFAVSDEKVGPSESQMESSFNRYLAIEATNANSKIKFAKFKKYSCKPSLAEPGQICSFMYFIEKPKWGASAQPLSGSITGRFFVDGDGLLRFETMTG